MLYDQPTLPDSLVSWVNLFISSIWLLNFLSTALLDCLPTSVTFQVNENGDTQSYNSLNAGMCDRVLDETEMVILSTCNDNGWRAKQHTDSGNTSANSNVHTLSVFSRMLLHLHKL